MPRGDKSGTVSQDRKGRWFARKCWTDAKGVEHWPKRYAKNEAEAWRKLVAIEKEIADIRAGKTTARSHEKIKTFKDAAEWCKQNVFKPPVYAGLTKVSGLISWQDVHYYMVPLTDFFGRMNFAAIDYDDIEAYVPWRLGRKKKGGGQVAITSVHRELAYLKRIFRIGRRRKWRQNNPFEEGEPLIQVAREKKVDRVLAFEEEPRLFAAFSAPKRGHLSFATEMAIETGLRLSEQFGLRFTDIDLEARLLTATSYKGRVAKRRLVPISGVLYPKLKAHIAERHRVIKALIREARIQRRAEFLFGYTDPTQAFAKACVDAEIKDLTWHCLRHTAITRMVHVYRMDPHAVMEMVGHDNWNTFWKTYVNVDRELAKAFGDQLNAARAALQQPTALPAQSEVESDAVN